jgi:hypothetical protein
MIFALRKVSQPFIDTVRVYDLGGNMIDTHECASAGVKDCL